jgi:uncharacterized protein
MTTSRSEHMAWCKKRAQEYVDQDNLTEAYASMVSDLGKHEETAGHMAIEMGMMQLMGGFLNTQSAMREFIDGFN